MKGLVKVLYVFIFFFCLKEVFPDAPTTKNSFTYFAGHQILSPGSNILYYSYPSPFLFTYDNYSQKIKSIDIETKEYNVFHQVDFKIGQMLFMPTGHAYVQNLTAGDEIIKWNYLASFALNRTIYKINLNSFKMKPFYPIYNKSTPDPIFYFVAYDQHNIQILDFDIKLVAKVTNNQIDFKCVCTFPEQNLIVSGGSDGIVRIWNYTANAGEDLTNVFNFSQTHSYPIEFLERGENSRLFLTADNTEKKVRIWNLDYLNTSLSYEPSFADWIIGVRSVSDSTAVVYGNGFTLDYFNVKTGNLIKSISLVNKTISSVEVLSVDPATKNERIAILASDGKVYVYLLNLNSGIVKTYTLFEPLFPQIENILYAMTFKKRNSTDNKAISIMTVVSDKNNNTVHFIDEKTLKNVTSITYSSEVRGLYQIMGRYLEIFQDLMLVWHGNSFTIYQIQDDGSISANYEYNSISGRTIEQLGVVYHIGIYAYAYISVIDKNNITTILNATSSNNNVTYFNETAGIKFFCHQNYFSNFAYVLPNDTLRIKSIDQGNFKVSDFPLANTILHPDITACFSKNIVGGGYYMTSNKSLTITYMYDGTILFKHNFTNITSTVYEGPPSFTTVNAIDNKVYQGVVGVGLINNYTVGYSPKKNGFMVQFIENYFYFINEKELAYYHLDCPFGSTQSNSLFGACFPNCNNSFISLTTQSCVKSCVSGTFPTPIIDTYNNFTAQLCQNYNSSILNCELGTYYGNSKKKCQKCDSKYYLFSTNSSTEYNLCVFPNEDRRLVGSVTNSDGNGIATWCYNKISDCYYCDWSPTNCSVCDWNFYKKKGLCDNCTNNTLFHNGSNNGTGYCYDCFEAMPHCDICNGNSTNCTKCFSSYYFDERLNLSCTDCSTPHYAKIGKKDGHGFCRNCSDVINQCIDCTEFGTQCTQCESSLYIDVDYNCTDCTEINKYKNGSNSGFGYCMYCNYSMPHCLNCYDNKSDCQLCMEDYYFYTDRSCVDCLQGNYYKIGVGDGNGTCHDCYTARPNCYLCNNNPTHCDLCFNNFWFDENNTCSNCSQTYFPTMYKNGSFNGSGKCLYCKDAIVHCNQCTNNATGCTHCDTNYYITYKNLTCSDCLANTTFKNSTGDGYGICYPCNAAFNNCTICDYPNNKCLVCHEDFFVNEFYRCQPYTFRPEYVNNSLSNSSLNFSIVNNRRYIMLSNPCDYNRSQWSLDARLHSYWIASTNFDKVDTITLKEIENLIKAAGTNETKANYSDSDWTFFGDTKNNKIVVTGRHDAHYKVKYFCIYGDTFSDETKPGMFDFYLPDNTGHNGRIYLSFEDHLVKDTLSNSLVVLACALQYASGINDTNQIITESGNHCNIHVDNVNLTTAKNDSKSNNSNSTNNTNSSNNSSRRVLQNSFVQTDLGIAVTYVFTFKKDVIYVNDRSSSVISDKLSSADFYTLLSQYLGALNASIYFPTPISGTFIVTDGMDVSSIPYPKIDPNFTIISKTTGYINFTVTGNDGILFIGIEKNKTSNPNLDELKKGVVNTNEDLEYYSSLFVKQNTKVTLNLIRLSSSIYYSFYHAGQNLFGTNSSAVNAYMFALNISKIPKNETGGTIIIDEGPPQTIIIAVVCSVVGLIILGCVVFLIVRWYKMRQDEKDDDKNSKQSPDKKYKEVSDKGPRPGDIFLPSQEVLQMPSGKDVMTENKI